MRNIQASWRALDRTKGCCTIVTLLTALLQAVHKQASQLNPYQRQLLATILNVPNSARTSQIKYGVGFAGVRKTADSNVFPAFSSSLRPHFLTYSRVVHVSKFFEQHSKAFDVVGNNAFIITVFTPVDDNGLLSVRQQFVERLVPATKHCFTTRRRGRVGI